MVAEELFKIRKRIIDSIEAELKKGENVIALCLEGSDVSNSFDEYSDIDMRVIVKKEKEKEAAEIIKLCVETFSPIKVEYLRTDARGVFQVIYQLENISKFLMIDVMIHSISDKIDISRKELIVLFNKDQSVKTGSFSQAEIDDLIKLRVTDFEKYLDFRHTYLKRQLLRKNYLESLKYYHFFILEKLVELFRLEFCPTRRLHYLKNISKDLPENIVLILEDLFTVDSLESIKYKSEKAIVLTRMLIKELKKKVI